MTKHCLWMVSYSPLRLILIGLKAEKDLVKLVQVQVLVLVLARMFSKLDPEPLMWQACGRQRPQRTYEAFYLN